jgi:hypothetical protein
MAPSAASTRRRSGAKFGPAETKAFAAGKSFLVPEIIPPKEIHEARIIRDVGSRRARHSSVARSMKGLPMKRVHIRAVPLSGGVRTFAHTLRPPRSGRPGQIGPTDTSLPAYTWSNKHGRRRAHKRHIASNTIDRDKRGGARRTHAYMPWCGASTSYHRRGCHRTSQKMLLVPLQRRR